MNEPFKQQDIIALLSYFLDQLLLREDDDSFKVGNWMIPLKDICAFSVSFVNRCDVQV